MAKPSRRERAAKKNVAAKTTPLEHGTDPAGESASSSAAKSQKQVKKTKVPVPKNTRRLPSSFVVAEQAWRLLWKRRWLFLGIVGVYAVLNLALVRGANVVEDFPGLKNLISDESPGAVGQVSTGITLLGFLVVESNNSVSDVVGAYQTFLVIVTSLAIIWALRQAMAGEQKIRIRDGFYKGMHPLIPVLLVAIVMTLQLLPFLLGAAVFNIVVTSGIAGSWFEVALWSLPLLLGIFLTFYWLISSVMALYIAALPDMTPLKALRSARDLVRGRRLSVLRKLLFLPFVLLLLAIIIMVPIIMLLAPIAPWVFFALTMLSIVLVHGYLYSLYRELLV
jgi:hypothetical protein